MSGQPIEKIGQMAQPDFDLQSMMSAIQYIAADIKDYHAKALLVFGSFARYLAGESLDHPPGDLDLLVVTNNPPLKIINTDYGCPVELHRFTVDRIVEIARSLRYDSRPVALFKLYGRNVMKQHAIDVIAAAMMLGTGYRGVGIEQIEIDGIADPRDYSIHRVLAGEGWWRRLCDYATQRRGPLLRFSDKLAGNDKFIG
jgi:predicted nucleotidyltransferase